MEENKIDYKTSKSMLIKIWDERPILTDEEVIIVEPNVDWKYYAGIYKTPNMNSIKGGTTNFNRISLLSERMLNDYLAQRIIQVGNGIGKKSIMAAPMIGQAKMIISMMIDQQTNEDLIMNEATTDRQYSGGSVSYSESMNRFNNPNDTLFEAVRAKIRSSGIESYLKMLEAGLKGAGLLFARDSYLKKTEYMGSYGTAFQKDNSTIPSNEDYPEDGDGSTAHTLEYMDKKITSFNGDVLDLKNKDIELENKIDNIVQLENKVVFKDKTTVDTQGTRAEDIVSVEDKILAKTIQEVKDTSNKNDQLTFEHVVANETEIKILHDEKADKEHVYTQVEIDGKDKVLSDRVDSNDRTDEIHDAEIKALFATNIAKSNGVIVSFHKEPQKITNGATMTTTNFYTKDKSVLYQSTDQKHIIMAGNQDATILIKGSYTTKETAHDAFTISVLIDGQKSEPALMNDKGGIKEFFFEATILDDNIQHTLQFNMNSSQGSYTIANLTLEIALIQQGSGTGGEIDWSEVIKTGDKINQDQIDDLKTGKINSFKGKTDLIPEYFNINDSGIHSKDFYNDDLKTKSHNGVGAINELLDKNDNKLDKDPWTETINGKLDIEIKGEEDVYVTIRKDRDGAIREDIKYSQDENYEDRLNILIQRYTVTDYPNNKNIAHYTEKIKYNKTSNNYDVITSFKGSTEGGPEGSYKILVISAMGSDQNTVSYFGKQNDGENLATIGHNMYMAALNIIEQKNKSKEEYDIKDIVYNLKNKYNLINRDKELWNLIHKSEKEVK